MDMLQTILYTTKTIMKTFEHALNLGILTLLCASIYAIFNMLKSILFILNILLTPLTILIITSIATIVGILIFRLAKWYHEIRTYFLGSQYSKDVTKLNASITKLSQLRKEVENKKEQNQNKHDK